MLRPIAQSIATELQIPWRERFARYTDTFDIEIEGHAREAAAAAPA